MNFAGFLPCIFTACQIGSNLTDVGKRLIENYLDIEKYILENSSHSTSTKKLTHCLITVVACGGTLACCLFLGDSLQLTLLKCAFVFAVVFIQDYLLVKHNSIFSHAREYQQLARRMRGTVTPLPLDPLNFPAPANEDQENESPFDLCKLKHIPEELEQDAIFKRFICPITQVPVRDPVGDPTICKENGEIISSVFERSVLVAWIQAHHKSPITNKPLEIHQLIFKPFLKRLIDQRLAFYSEHFKRLAARKLNTIPLSQVQTQPNAEQENRVL